MVELENKAVDLERIHPSLRGLYGNGVPVKVYRTESGATVRIFGACLPETEEEREERLRRAWETADGIAARARKEGRLRA